MGVETALTFSVTLLAAVLISDRADRTVLSTAVLFLLVGFGMGGGGFHWINATPEGPVVSFVAELALVSVLYTDGMRAGWSDLRRAYQLPGRALVFGLPLTLLGTAVLARYVVGMPWAESLLIGAALCPTDPVFASAIVGREEVPGRLRALLNVESGLNDGLALPLVLILLKVVGSHDEESSSAVMRELGLGVLLGIAIPWMAIRLEQAKAFAASPQYRPLLGFVIGLLVYVVALATRNNAFLAAFAAGITVATIGPEVRAKFHEFGEIVAELLKLLALLLFGALISWQFLRDIPVSGYIFAVLSLLLVRPVALWIALIGSGLDRKEFVAAAWFGPKGFASVVYGILILKAGVPRSNQIFHLIALVIAGSILAHSSTDVVVARWFHLDEAGKEHQEPDPGLAPAHAMPEGEAPEPAA